MESTQYLKSADGLTREELENRTDWTSYVSCLSYAANQHLVVYEKVTDKVGNTEYFSTDGIIVDNTSPVPVVTITPTSPDGKRRLQRRRSSGIQYSCGRSDCK